MDSSCGARSRRPGGGFVAFNVRAPTRCELGAERSLAVSDEVSEVITVHERQQRLRTLRYFVAVLPPYKASVDGRPELGDRARRSYAQEAASAGQTRSPAGHASGDDGHAGWSVNSLYEGCEPRFEAQGISIECEERTRSVDFVAYRQSQR
jgi:hypothetical protein